jgi:hypothetical protein
VQTDGVQSISWIKTDSGDIGELGTRGIGFGYMESREGSLGLRIGLKTIRELMEG